MTAMRHKLHVPENLPPKPGTQKAWKKPVSWLLGPQLIASLKWTILYAAFKGKLDPRDWMKAQEISLKIEERYNLQTPADEYWIDYFSDTGDGQKAMYSLAYLSMSDLYAEDSLRPGASVAFDDEKNRVLLPRGEFLFVGGDTSYHVADFPSLAGRFQSPFWWAYLDLKEEGKLSDSDPRRPLFGIPGNHDYYDVIDGFNRQFQKPLTDEDAPNHAGMYPQLSIPGYKRLQQASYVALCLPFGWSMWGLDCEVGRLDLRQQEFFKQANGGVIPDKLIVATPEPTTVLGRRAAADEKIPRAFKDLGLEAPFMNGESLPPGKCRLDLSGDTHHYARYWGPARDALAPSATNYASVVSGLGGAFLHPTHTQAREIREQALYPAADVSRRRIAKEIFNPINIINGGYVALIGGLIATLIYFGATIPQSSSTVVDAVLHKLFGVPGAPAASIARMLPDLPYVGVRGGTGLGVLALALRAILLIASLGFIVAGLAYARRVIDMPRALREANIRLYGLRLAGLILAGFTCLAAGIWQMAARRATLPPFICSLLIGFLTLWAATAITGSIFYTEWLFKRSYREPVGRRDYWPVWLLAVTGTLMLVAGAALFGRYPAVYHFLDIIFALSLFGTFAFIVAIGPLAGAHRRGVGTKIGFTFLSLWHALLMLGTPFLLVRIGSWLSWLAALALIPIFMAAGNFLVRHNSKAWLTVAWIVYGGMVLGLPFLLSAPVANEARAWEVAGNTLAAAALGAIMTCVWLGWYFAVSLAFNGHNDQAGAAARVEGYKQFMRIRIKQDELTAFVIAVDKPDTVGKKLEPRIVDVFRLQSSGQCSSNLK
jgi:hypothetical protein